MPPRSKHPRGGEPPVEEENVVHVVQFKSTQARVEAERHITMIHETLLELDGPVGREFMSNLGNMILIFQETLKDTPVANMVLDLDSPSPQPQHRPEPESGTGRPAKRRRVVFDNDDDDEDASIPSDDTGSDTSPPPARTRRRRTPGGAARPARDNTAAPLVQAAPALKIKFPISPGYTVEFAREMSNQFHDLLQQKRDTNDAFASDLQVQAYNLKQSNQITQIVFQRMLFGIPKRLEELVEGQAAYNQVNVAQELADDIVAPTELRRMSAAFGEIKRGDLIGMFGAIRRNIQLESFYRHWVSICDKLALDKDHPEHILLVDFLKERMGSAVGVTRRSQAKSWLCQQWSLKDSDFEDIMMSAAVPFALVREFGPGALVLLPENKMNWGKSLPKPVTLFSRLSEVDHHGIIRTLSGVFATSIVEVVRKGEKISLSKPGGDAPLGIVDVLHQVLPAPALFRHREQMEHLGGGGQGRIIEEDSGQETQDDNGADNGDDMDVDAEESDPPTFNTSWAPPSGTVWKPTALNRPDSPASGDGAPDSTA